MKEHMRHPTDAHLPLCGRRGKDVFMVTADPKTVSCGHCRAKMNTTTHTPDFGDCGCNRCLRASIKVYPDG